MLILIPNTCYSVMVYLLVLIGKSSKSSWLGCWLLFSDGLVKGVNFGKIYTPCYSCVHVSESNPHQKVEK